MRRNVEPTDLRHATYAKIYFSHSLSNPLLRKLKTTFLSHPDLRKGSDPYGFLGFLSRDIKCGDERLGNCTKVWQGSYGFLCWIFLQVLAIQVIESTNRGLTFLHLETLKLNDQFLDSKTRRDRVSKAWIFLDDIFGFSSSVKWQHFSFRVDSCNLSAALMEICLFFDTPLWHHRPFSIKEASQNLLRREQEPRIRIMYTFSPWPAKGCVLAILAVALVQNSD